MSFLIETFTHQMQQIMVMMERAVCAIESRAGFTDMGVCATTGKINRR